MKRTAKQIIFLIFLCSLFSVLCSLSYAEDKIAAVVNGEIITQKDLNDFLNFTRMQYSRGNQGKEEGGLPNLSKEELLQRLIEDRLILQEAKKEKVSPEEARVKSKLDEIKRHYPTESEFAEDLAKQGLVRADLENKIRDQLMTMSIIDQKVRSKVRVYPVEVTSFYEGNKKLFIKPRELQLLVFTFKNEDLARAFSYQLRIGKKPEDLATRYSFTFNNLNVSEGDDLRPEIKEAVFKLGFGEISNAVKVDNQYYIFKLVNIIDSRQLTLNQAQEKIQAYLFDKKMQESLLEWLNGLRKQAYIKLSSD